MKTVMNKCPEIFRKFGALVMAILISMPCLAQKIATLEVNLKSETPGLDIPVHVTLDPITHLSGADLSLVEIQGNKSVPVIFQVEHGQQRKLTWLVNAKVKKHVYELIKDASTGSNSN